MTVGKDWGCSDGGSAWGCGFFYFMFERFWRSGALILEPLAVRHIERVKCGLQLLSPRALLEIMAQGATTVVEGWQSFIRNLNPTGFIYTHIELLATEKHFG